MAQQVKKIKFGVKRDDNFTADQGTTKEFGFGGVTLSHARGLEPGHVPTGSPAPRPPASATTDILSPDEHVWIDDLGEGVYRVRQPFSIKITRIGAGNFEASFREANIAISGIDRDDAYQALVAEILDTLGTLEEEPNLIPSATKQLQVLREYIVQEKA